MSTRPTQNVEVIDPQLLSTLLEAIQPVTPPADLRAKVLARAIGSNSAVDLKIAAIDLSAQESYRPAVQINSTPFEGYVDKVMSMFDLGVEQARAILIKAASRADDTFAPCGIPGVRLFYFQGGARAANATCGILKIRAGTIFPAHEHQAGEHVVILQGAAIESTGRCYRAGDVIYHQKGTRHSFRVAGNEPMFLAVLLERPNKWLKGQIILDHLLKRWRFADRAKKE